MLKFFHLHVVHLTVTAVPYGTFGETLQRCYNMTFVRQNIRKHFMVYGGCEQFAQAFLSLQYVKNMSVVVLERLTKRNVKANSVVAPYH